MKEAKIKIGLVLAGGDAKGAYQSGLVKYLAEIDFAPLMIAGTSIGALNGAILASGTSFFTNTHNRAIAPRKFYATSGNNKEIKGRSTSLLVNANTIKLS